MLQVFSNNGNSRLVIHNFNYLYVGFSGDKSWRIWLHAFVNDSEANLQYLCQLKCDTVQNGIKKKGGVG